MADAGTCELPLDELACEVVQKALKHRAEARKEGANQGQEGFGYRLCEKKLNSC
jgi:hypothetical protein